MSGECWRRLEDKLEINVTWRMLEAHVMGMVNEVGLE